MEALIISDLHMHKWQYGSRLTEQGYNSRLWYLYKALVRVSEIAVAQKVDCVCVCGDIFHTHDKVDVQTLFLTTVGLMQIAKVCPLYLLVGNHDMASASGEIHALKPFEAFATIIDKPMKFEVAGCPMIAHPYTKDIDRLYDFLNTAEEGSMALVHQGVAGAKLGSSWIPDEKFGTMKLTDNIVTCWAGHYHSPQSSTQIIIPGSIAQHTWADKDDFRGAWWVNSNEGRVELPLNTPRFVDVEWFDSFRDLNIEEGSGPNFVNSNFIRVLNCPTDFDIDRVREAFLALDCESVEFLFQNDVGIHSTSGVVKTGDFSIEPLLEEYEKINMPSRRKLIGKQIREFRYEVPNG